MNSRCYGYFVDTKILLSQRFPFCFKFYSGGHFVTSGYMEAMCHDWLKYRHRIPKGPTVRQLQDHISVC